MEPLNRSFRFRASCDQEEREFGKNGMGEESHFDSRARPKKNTLDCRMSPSSDNSHDSPRKTQFRKSKGSHDQDDDRYDGRAVKDISDVKECINRDDELKDTKHGKGGKHYKYDEKREQGEKQREKNEHSVRHSKHDKNDKHERDEHNERYDRHSRHDRSDKHVRDRDRDPRSDRSKSRLTRSSKENDDYDDYDDRGKYYSETNHMSDYTSKRSSRHHSPRYSVDYYRDSRSSRDREYYRDITPLHLMKSKLNNWDVPPAEYPGISAKQLKASCIFSLRSATVNNTDESAYHSSKYPRNDSRRSPRVLNDTHNTFNSSNVASQAANVSRQARRLYVGNIPYDITVDFLVEFLNNTMVRCNLAKPDSNPVILAQINHDKSFAFVEFKTPEDATIAIALDNITLTGQSLKIRRPKDYQPPPVSVSQIPTLNIPNSFNNNIRENNDRIFIGNIPFLLDEDQVKELLKPFGELKTFNLVKDNTAKGNTKSFAFCEYLDPSVTDSACSGLNGMELADKRIIVQRANAWSGPRTHDNTVSNGPSSTILPFSAPPSAPNIPSATLILLNMLTFDDIIDEREYIDIIDDIKDECQNFGEVVAVSIPINHDTSNTTKLPKVYVEFLDKDSCSRALNSLAGRTFMDRTVICTYCNHPVPES